MTWRPSKILPKGKMCAPRRACSRGPARGHGASMLHPLTGLRSALKPEAVCGCGRASSTCCS
eukprot:14032053-Ditylum_brightwellii.AAC.1